MAGNIIFVIKIALIVSLCGISFPLLIFLYYNAWRNFFTKEPPFVLTRKSAIPYIVDALNLSAESVLYDIGCGDGRILKAAIRNKNGVTAVGIDLNPIACIIARIRNRRIQIKIYQGDIFNYSLSEATHIYCYLLPHFLEKLEPKIKKDCRDGTVIVNCDFPFPTLSLTKEIKLSKSKFGCDTIYIYKI